MSYGYKLADPEPGHKHVYLIDSRYVPALKANISIVYCDTCDHYEWYAILEDEESKGVIINHIEVPHEYRTMTLQELGERYIQLLIDQTHPVVLATVN